MYAGFVLIISCVVMTSFTTPDKNQQVLNNYTVSNEADEVIYITEEGFSNPDLWIGKTQPVTFINSGALVHSVTDDYGEFDSGPLYPGQSFTISFPHAGVWTYHDNYSRATGTISVMGRDE